VIANVWSSQQVADRALQRFQMARRAGLSVDAATDFAFEVGHEEFMACADPSPIVLRFEDVPTDY
jgi:hypothetical protein